MRPAALVRNAVPPAQWSTIDLKIRNISTPSALATDRKKTLNASNAEPGKWTQ
jgi:hypothetical protein